MPPGSQSPARHEAHSAGSTSRNARDPAAISKPQRWSCDSEIACFSDECTSAIIACMQMASLGSLILMFQWEPQSQSVAAITVTCLTPHFRLVSSGCSSATIRAFSQHLPQADLRPSFRSASVPMYSLGFPILHADRSHGKEGFDSRARTRQARLHNLTVSLLRSLLPSAWARIN